LADGPRLWEEIGRDAVVYTYIDHLRQLAENAFDLADKPGAEVRLPRNLKIALLDFDIKAKREKFEQETFECGVCLEPKKGANCHRLLLCSHVFCIPCLQDFYNTCITEGEVDSVKCLAPDCGQDPSGPADPPRRNRRRKKKDQTLNPSELLQIPLEPGTVQRYVFLKRKRRLEADRTTVYCPRKWCQGAARSKKHPKPSDPLTDDLGDSDGEEEEDVLAFDPLGDESQLPPIADRVAICEDCGYAFCCVCKKGWHGELVHCFPRREAELSAEEKATEDYLRLYTTPCPTCSAPCQKRMGCNHMICFKCGTHFCYLCSSWLMEDNPYKHFNTSESKCFNRLWDLEGGDGINPEGAEALHEVPVDQFELEDTDDEDDVDRNTDDNRSWELESNDSDDDDDDDDDDSDDDDDDDSYDDGDDDDDAGGAGGAGAGHWRQPPPPPAPIPPRVIPIDPARPNQWRDGRGLDAAGRAAAAERHAQALAMAQVRIDVRRQQGIHYFGGV
jgi:E3 ubiquitin-protein ligase RNF14